MYKIKQQPTDFVVKEIFSPQIKETGKYAYFTLKKTNYTTLDAVQKIANTLGIPLKHIGFAGTKDKRAITEQTCSAKNIKKEQLLRIKLKDIEINFIGYVDKPVSLGDHEGNYFKITIRNITKTPSKKTNFINYFGEQRFNKNNAEIGKLLTQKKFKEALFKLSLDERNGTSSVSTAEILNEPAIKAHLEQYPQDYLGAIKKLPIKQLKFYIHAYQAKLWNEMAENTLAEQRSAVHRKSATEKTIPIIGFGTKETNLIKEILKKEGITTRDFIIKPFPELSSEGGERVVFSEAKNLKISELEDDDLNAGMKKITLEFELQKGSYATEFVRQLF
ncbi:tRNA pseudouridine(13) synthase TruD [Candidatus Woesearchaeota archaeon]|nr:tRNA pseudouridine(13) synthase TruD [Candidatus Woesearchaeota archaeon]